MPPDQPAGGTGGSPQSDDAWVEAWLAGTWRRWRAWHVVRCVALGVGVSLAASALPVVRAVPGLWAMAGALATALALVATSGLRDVGVVVRGAEVDAPALRNALFAWHEGRGTLSPAIRQRLAAHAKQVLSEAHVSHPVSRAAWAMALAVLVLGISMSAIARRERASVTHRDGAASHTETPGVAARPLEWTTVVTPPAYAGRAVARGRRPSRLDILAGSRVDIAFTGWPREAAARLGTEAVPLTGTDEARSVTFTAKESDVLLVQEANGGVLASITLVVTPDAPPSVRITAPAADLRRAEPTGTVAISVVARDDIGLHHLRLRFTKVSGSGESFTFEDGEWPVRVARRSRTEWTGTYTLDLARAGLGPGDSIAYHAVAHDARVGRDGAAESERFLIEITRPGALAAGDFSLPEPEEKFALSQRMVIQLTERLLERRPRMTAEAFRQEAQVLAIAQRRVRAEFVFMLGGEVEDEFEEAAHSHEVEAGRLDNKGQGDLTEAVRQMSLAETRLTDASVREALPYEYKALAALQAAFGKARYFMRTLPAPVQIDASRRLQADRAQAGSSHWEVAALPDASRGAALDLLRQLEVPGASVARVLPQLVALDRQDPAWVADLQRAAANDGAPGVARMLRTRLLPGSTGWMSVPLGRTPDEAAIAASGRARP